MLLLFMIFFTPPAIVMWDHKRRLVLASVSLMSMQYLIDEKSECRNGIGVIPYPTTTTSGCQLWKMIFGNGFVCPSFLIRHHHTMSTTWDYQRWLEGLSVLLGVKMGLKTSICVAYYFWGTIFFFLRKWCFFIFTWAVNKWSAITSSVVIITPMSA